MHPEGRNGSSDLNEAMDFQSRRSNGNGKIPISLLLNHEECGGEGYIAPRVPVNTNVHGTNFANTIDVNYGTQAMASQETAHMEINNLTEEVQKGRDDVIADGEQNIGDENDGETDEFIPAWVKAEPVDGYIKHPVAGYVMHPSFYDNPHITDCKMIPGYSYDGEVDDPLCPAGKHCTHARDCFEVRVRMAVLSYLRHNISYRDAEHIWGVSRSTIQRRKAILKDPNSVIFLLTPKS